MIRIPSEAPDPPDPPGPAEVRALFDELAERPPTDRESALAAVAYRNPALAAAVRGLLSGLEEGGRLDAFARELESVRSATPPLLLPLPEGTLLGPWRILRTLARGGMGTVHLAERADGQFALQVAIKLIRREVDTPELRRRFLVERQILARIAHPGIARLVDGGITADGRPWLAMDYIEGEPLDRFCDARSLTVRQRLAVFLQVCEAVGHAHRHLVVHRDLKPANILVDAGGTPRLLDFGIARLEDQEIAGATAAGLRPYTPDWASPEQRAGAPVSTAGDVWQLGVILLELLAGPRSSGIPGRQEDMPTASPGEVPPPRPSVVIQHQGDAAAVAASRGTTPERLRRDLGGDLDIIVAAATRPEPEHRYRSVEALAGDIRRFLSGRPILARPGTLRYVASRFVRRHRTAVAAAGIAGALVVGFLVATVHQSRAVRLERDRAREMAALLGEVFQGASPYALLGEEPTLGEVLDRGVLELRLRLADQPALRASLLVSLADVYRGLGRLERADALLSEALAPGGGLEDLRERGAALALRGDVRVAMGRVPESLADLREASSSLEVGSLEHVRALTSMGHALQLAGDGAAARAVLDSALPLARALPSRPGTVAATLNELAWLDAGEGELARAVSRTEEALALRTTAYGEEDPATASTLLSLSGLLRRTASQERADSLARRGLEVRRGIFPEGHHLIGAAELEVGLSRSALGDAAGAEAHLRSALAILRARHGGMHLNVASALLELGTILAQGGRPDEAEPLQREALHIYRSLRGDQDPTSAVAGTNLAYTHVLLGRGEEAAALYASWVPVFESLSGAMRTGGAPLVDYGALLRGMGRGDEATEVLERALALEARDLGPDHWRLARVHGVLGAVLFDEGHLARAEPHLLEAHRILAVRPADDPYLVSARGALAVLYRRMGRDAEALRFGGPPLEGAPREGPPG